MRFSFLITSVVYWAILRCSWCTSTHILSLVNFTFHPSFLVHKWEGEGKHGENNIASVRTGGRAHVYNDMHAWLIAHLSDTDCDTHWSDCLHLILPPRMHLLVLEHPCMHFRCDEAVWASYATPWCGWVACPWTVVKKRADRDIRLKWWSCISCRKGSTPPCFSFTVCVTLPHYYCSRSTVLSSVQRLLYLTIIFPIFSLNLYF